MAGCPLMWWSSSRPLPASSAETLHPARGSALFHSHADVSNLQYVRIFMLEVERSLCCFDLTDDRRGAFRRSCRELDRRIGTQFSSYPQRYISVQIAPVRRTGARITIPSSIARASSSFRLSKLSHWSRHHLQ